MNSHICKRHLQHTVDLLNFPCCLQRPLSQAVNQWKKCVEVLSGCSARVMLAAVAKPYLLFLGSGSALPAGQDDVRDALIRDCLCHVRAIEVSRPAGCFFG